jgi:hypothetical protein
MVRSLFRFALPGGRRVFVVYLPPKRETAVKPALPVNTLQQFDRVFAQAGLHFDIPTQSAPAKGKRTR